ncbi:uncharacterized protein [Macrobrachium rosenbergii]|uniref:uncharacterized protein n=1 Tax=Macrobrachium rosenbergii TaxID=79674 RepID=UPI0034D43A0F
MGFWQQVMQTASVVIYPYKVSPTVCKVVDGILQSNKDLPSHLQHIHQMLTRCHQYGITRNKEKFATAAPKVNFCGYVLSSHSITADPKVSAICDFPTPSNVTDLRSFVGLVNQLADFTLDITATAQPLRPLMSPNVHSFGPPTMSKHLRRSRQL